MFLEARTSCLQEMSFANSAAIGCLGKRHQNSSHLVRSHLNNFRVGLRWRKPCASP